MLKRWLRYRPAYGKLIPPEARVNAMVFSEDEFPVVCPKCCYLLRGLSDGPCPECGRPFDRGRLLVEQYVLEGGSRFHPWTARMSNWALWLVFGVPLVSGFGFWLYLRYVFVPSSPAPGSITTLLIVVRVWIVVLGIGVVVAAVSTVLSVRMSLRNRRKSRQVFDAIDLAGARLLAQGE